MANDAADPQSPLLADVMARPSYEDRVALLEHATAAAVHAQSVVERLRAAEGSESLTLRPVEIHLLAAICHLELAAGALGVGLEAAARPRPWWARWVWWR